jgi:hypothetical protein
VLTNPQTNPWLRTGFTAWWLGVEASTVIGLRLLKIGCGGAAAEAEARKMFNEKIESGFALQSLALAGRLGHTAHGATSKSWRITALRCGRIDVGSLKDEPRSR